MGTTALPVGAPAADHGNMRTLDLIGGTEILREADCWALLGGGGVGRLAVSVRGQPDIFPVNFEVTERAVLFRTNPGHKLLGALTSTVAFEVDRIDDTSRSGWSVVIHGTAAPVDADASPVHAPWAGPKAVVVRIEPVSVSGRRVVPHPGIGTSGPSVPAPEGPTLEGMERAEAGITEELDASEILRFLNAKEVGRLAVVVDRYPQVFPVNYRMDGHTVVFRTNRGTKLEAANHANVAFQVDHIDPYSRSGWSVQVLGMAEDITDQRPGESKRRAEAIGVRSWAGYKDRLIRIIPARMSGRRVSPGQLDWATDGRGYI